MMSHKLAGAASTFEKGRRKSIGRKFIASNTGVIADVNLLFPSIRERTMREDVM